MRQEFLKTLGVSAALFAMVPSANAVPLEMLDGIVNFSFDGVTTEQVLEAGSDENTWGVGNVNSIQAADGITTVWTTGETGQRLTFMLYGIHDISTTPGGSFGTNIYSAGATGGAADGAIHLDIYLDDEDDGGYTAADFSPGPAGRTGFGSYGTATDGTLWLSTVLVTGVSLDDPVTLGVNELTATLFQNADGATSPATGTGRLFASITGGSAAAKFDTNDFVTLDGSIADLRGLFDIEPNDTSIGCTDPFTGAVNVNTGCWEISTNDPVTGRASTFVPVPGTALLMALGLLAVPRLLRKRG